MTLDDLKQPEAAFEAYLKAREIYPDNISALLNLFDAVARGMHPEMKETIERQLRDKVEHVVIAIRSGHSAAITVMCAMLELFVRMGWQWALSSSPGSVLAGLRGAYAMQQDEQKRAALSAMMASLYEMRGDFKQSAAEYKRRLNATLRIPLRFLDWHASHCNAVLWMRRVPSWKTARRPVRRDASCGRIGRRFIWCRVTCRALACCCRRWRRSLMPRR